MRGVLKKIERGLALSEIEYEDLLKYIENLQKTSPEAYAVFHDQYASVLFNEYSTFVPRFVLGGDDFINYLWNHPDLCKQLSQSDLPLTMFPSDCHPYLEYTFGSTVPVQAMVSTILPNNIGTNDLPHPRLGQAILKYEKSNPYKEQGLKSHFERLARYSFITRLQSYRYLTRSKSSYDRIEYHSPDRLGGIFTNKQKSIYYYIFLSEAEEIKARNACEFLNLILYDRT
jgi:hypothetical protein